MPAVHLDDGLHPARDRFNLERHRTRALDRPAVQLERVPADVLQIVALHRLARRRAEVPFRLVVRAAARGDRELESEDVVHVLLDAILVVLKLFPRRDDAAAVRSRKLRRVPRVLEQRAVPGRQSMPDVRAERAVSFAVLARAAGAVAPALVPDVHAPEHRDARVENLPRQIERRLKRQHVVPARARAADRPDRVLLVKEPRVEARHALYDDQVAGRERVHAADFDDRVCRFRDAAVRRAVADAAGREPHAVARGREVSLEPAHRAPAVVNVV
mmetsp:Transcript_1452/g.4838  ORF Transcript_1452/g.4838 Transcript_1452/m.4838 type:complete len:273 (-) Transcript_1452:819-1637(-)